MGRNVENEGELTAAKATYAYSAMNQLLQTNREIIDKGDAWARIRLEEGYTMDGANLDPIREGAEKLINKAKKELGTFEARYARVGAMVQRLSGNSIDCKIAWLDASTDLLSPIREFTERVAANWNFSDREFGLEEVLEGVCRRQEYEQELLKRVWVKRSNAKTADPLRTTIAEHSEAALNVSQVVVPDSREDELVSLRERNQIIESLSGALRKAILAYDAAFAALSAAGLPTTDKDAWKWIQACDELEDPGTFEAFSRALGRARSELVLQR